MTEHRPRARNQTTHRRRSHTSRRAAPAFTLIELLITLVLMMIVATMYYGFASPSHQRQQKTLCQQNLQKLYLAMEIYAADFKGAFPDKPKAQTSDEALDALVPRYTVDTSVFICPGSKDSALPAGEPIRNRRISYAYYLGRRTTDTNSVLVSDRQVDTEAKKANDLVFSANGKPPGNNHHKYGGSFLFVDGHTDATSSRPEFALPLEPGVKLLNPKP